MLALTSRKPSTILLRDQALAGVAAKCIEIGAADYADKLSETIEDDTAYALH